MIGQDLRQIENSQSLEALLELQRSDAAGEHDRASERYGIHCRIEVYEGNSDQRQATPILAVCSDLSAGGCRLIAETPVAVGSIYWLAFEKSVELPPVFARCVRCRLLRENAFEGGFQFFSEVALPDAPTHEEDDLIDVV